jgi:CheY-like chemotaxis protein
MAVSQRVLRVLLAEDDPDHQKIVTYILRERGHTVDIAEDGQQAFCMAQENCYDVILMDVKMPGTDGMEATKAIRAREDGNRRVPIIAMTAHAMKGDRERFLAVGMDSYISKPLNRQELIEMVERLGGGLQRVRVWRVTAVSAGVLLGKAGRASATIGGPDDSDASRFSRKASNMTIRIDGKMTVRDLVGRYPQTRPVFEKHGIGYCCGGGKCLTDVADTHGLKLSVLVDDLEEVLQPVPSEAKATEKNWYAAPLRELVDRP